MMLTLRGRIDDSGIPDDGLVEPSQIDDADPALLGKVCIGIPECVSADLDCTADNSRKLAHAEVEKKSVAGVDTSSIRTNEARWMKPDKMKEVDLNDSGNVASLMVKNEEKNCTHHLHETKQFYLGYGFEKHKHQLKITREYDHNSMASQTGSCLIIPKFQSYFGNRDETTLFAARTISEIYKKAAAHLPCMDGTFFSTVLRVMLALGVTDKTRRLKGSFSLTMNFGCGGQACDASGKPKTLCTRIFEVSNTDVTAEDMQLFKHHVAGMCDAIQVAADCFRVKQKKCPLCPDAKRFKEFADFLQSYLDGNSFRNEWITPMLCCVSPGGGCDEHIDDKGDTVPGYEGLGSFSVPF